MTVSRTLASGARQLVVHDALETTSMEDGSYLSSLTPITNIGASADGAEMITFFAPPFRCAAAWGAYQGQSAQLLLNQGLALDPVPLHALHLERQEKLCVLQSNLAQQVWLHTFSLVVNTPVESHTYVAPASPQGIDAGSLQQRPELETLLRHLAWLLHFYVAAPLLCPQKLHTYASTQSLPLTTRLCTQKARKSLRKSSSAGRTSQCRS